MATVFNRSLARPAKDEWGVYDPQQAGLAALYARLDTKDNSNVPTMPAANTIPEKKIDVVPARPSLRDAK
jgi:hypothetical protein